MKPSHDDTLLRRTLQEIYSAEPQSTKSDWEQMVMQEIDKMSAPEKKEKRRKGIYIGWLASAAVAAVVALFFMITTEGSLSDSSSLPQSELAQSDSGKQVSPTPIKKVSAPTSYVAEVSQPASKATPQKDVQTASEVKSTKQTANVQKQTANVQKQLTQAESAQKVEAKAVSPYERGVIRKETRPTRNSPVKVDEEDLRRMNDFSLAAYDRLRGIEVGQPQPEEPAKPAAEPTVVRVARSMSATAITALSQDLQHRKLAFVDTSK